MGVESTSVTAGLGGFLVLFGLAIACWLLFRSMNNHLRGVSYRESQEAAQRAKARAESDASAKTAASPSEPKRKSDSVEPQDDDGLNR